MAPKPIEAQGSALLSLPPELRYYIWELSVVKPKPLISYVVNKPIWKRFSEADGERLEIEDEAYPKLPAIALACRQIYQEVPPIFYGKNTFIFTEGEIFGSMNSHSVVSKWESAKTHRRIYPSEEDYRPGLSIWKFRQYSNVSQLALLRHVILEFRIPDANYSFQHEEHPAMVEAKLQRDGQVEVRFGGCLEEICVCKLKQELELFSEVDSQGLFKKYEDESLLLEYMLRSSKLRSSLKYPSRYEKTCDACGKQFDAESILDLFSS